MLHPRENINVRGGFTVQCSNELNPDGVHLFSHNNELYSFLNNELLNFINGFTPLVPNAVYFEPWDQNAITVFYSLKGLLELTDPVFTVTNYEDGWYHDWYHDPDRKFSLHFSNYLTDSDIKFLAQEAVKTGLFAVEEHFKANYGYRYNSVYKNNSIEQINPLLILKDFECQVQEPLGENIIIPNALELHGEEVLKEWFQAYLDNEEIPMMQKTEVLSNCQVFGADSLYKKDDDLER